MQRGYVIVSARESRRMWDSMTIGARLLAGWTADTGFSDELFDVLTSQMHVGAGQ